MKKFTLKFYTLSVLSFIFISTNSFAKNYGAGAMIGSYTALSGEYQVSNESSYDTSLAFDLGDKRQFHFHASQLFHKPDSLKMDGQVFGWYYGLGARYRTYEKKKSSDNDYKFGARASIGLLYDFESPIKIFSELSFVFHVLPETSTDTDFNIGVRYYF